MTDFYNQMGLIRQHFVKMEAENARYKEALEKIANMEPLGYPTTQTIMQLIAKEALKGE